MFQASHPWGFLDYFRVPYEVTGPQEGDGPRFLSRVRGIAGTSLLWPRAELASPGIAARYRLGGSWLVGSVVADADAARFLPRVGHGWRPVRSVRREDGAVVASVWRDLTGNVYVPFDLAEVMETLWSERYRQVQSSRASALARRALLRGYYAVKPAVPRSTQLALRRRLSRVQGRSAFPRWPVEDSLHDLYAWMFSVLTQIAGGPVPWLDVWPAGRSWAMVLTHDVETEIGYRNLHLLRDPERAGGYRSSWNFVPDRYPERYEVGTTVLHELRDQGCEIGVHGLRHDGRDLGSRRLLEQRLPEIRAHAERWGAVGFRSPATQRVWEWMPEMGFAYDSSYTDTDPYEPQAGGCCTYLPFLNRGQVELPITLPQDHTLFTVLGHTDGGLWIDKARHLRERCGMVLVLTHPDYAVDPRVTGAYRALLEEFRDDDTAWRALPAEVDDWWRRRVSSSVRATADGWRIDGPAAADGAVRLSPPVGHIAETEVVS
ncbi:hypothetical protein [Petropleomorpha daqingensis]|uniref:Polysaccharide deacetylase n=1 Tax=Petropleomorpha daqingensis TaxID=2026353 RepID=A0A853CHV2_9ACTN|nr:hypothetical protein [Petropleomorpha daqingensis]NYJ05848.1 hypothetical protein [Petropleomorpha daqingensis]